mgnify:CR=1 FL=1
MKRIATAMAVCILFLSGVTWYMSSRNLGKSGESNAVELQAAEARYDLEVTPTFSAKRDPFALRTDDREEEAALSVRLGDREILAVKQDAPAGQPIVVHHIEGLVRGWNELYLQAAPPADAYGVRHFVHMRLLRDGAPVAEKTFWSDGGALVAGSVKFRVEEAEGEADGD